jgi:hypothetical protein
MYNMVDEVDVIKDGMYSKKKSMYLTNTQAGLFTEPTMVKCIEALDVGEPKFVINLLPSAGLAALVWKAVKYSDSEVDDIDAAELNAQLLLFMKTCIIPIAIQTHALILVSGSSSCSLGSALSSVAVLEQARFGNRCPFTVVALAAEKDVFYQAVKSKHSIAAQVCEASVAWKQHSKLQRSLMPLAPSHVDLIPGAARYVIFEEIDTATGAFNFLPRRSFESIFVQLMAKRLPCVAIQCCGCNLDRLADLASRNVPVLLLDSNKRSFTYNKTLKDEALELLKQKPYAFPLIFQDKVHEHLRVEDNFALTLESRRHLLHTAMGMIDAQLKNNMPEHYDSSLYAFFHSVLHVGADAVFDTSSEKKETKLPNQDQENKKGDSTPELVKPLWEKLEALEKEKQTNKRDLVQPIVPHELAAEAIRYIQRTEPERQRSLEKFLKQTVESIEKYEGPAGTKDIAHELKKDGDTSAAGEFNPDLMPSKDAKDDSIQWLALFDVFTNPCFHSSSIHDVDEITNIITTIAKIDRLPQETSLESLRTIQDAWDHVEIYHSMGDRYKFLTLFFFIMVLGLGISVTFVSILGSIKFISASYPLIMISFFTTFVIAFVSFLNPAIRWQQLRLGALAIESNSFTFRARAGIYRVDVTDSNSIAAADELLTEAIMEVKTAVLEGAEIKNTQFYSHVKPTKRHQQHRPDYVGGAFGLPERPERRSWFSYSCWDESVLDDKDLYDTTNAENHQPAALDMIDMNPLPRSNAAHLHQVVPSSMSHSTERIFMEENPMKIQNQLRMMDLEKGISDDGEEIILTDEDIVNYIATMKREIKRMERDANKGLLDIETPS